MGVGLMGDSAESAAKDDVDIFITKERDLQGGGGGGGGGDGGGGDGDAMVVTQGDGYEGSGGGDGGGFARGHVIGLLRSSVDQYTKVMTLIDTHRFR